MHLINPALKVMMVIPNYVDFAQFTKKHKFLKPTDFERLNSFSLQIMDLFKALFQAVFSLNPRSVFSFDMNYTLTDKKLRNVFPTPGRQVDPGKQMRFYPGTLVDG